MIGGRHTRDRRSLSGSDSSTSAFQRAQLRAHGPLRHISWLGRASGVSGVGMFVVREDNLESEQTRSLLAMHLAGMHANSPPGSVFALDLSGLQAPEVTVWVAWQGDLIASIGALKMLDSITGEVKSMRTHPAFLRMGAAALILERIIATARSRGAKQLSLETGSGPAFEPPLSLYRRRGFINGEAFSDYAQSDFNQFLHLRLDEQR